MKKIWLMSAVVSTLLCAQEITQESIAQQLEDKKIKSAKSSSYMPDISLIVDVSYNNISFDEEGHKSALEYMKKIYGARIESGREIIQSITKKKEKL